MKGTYFVTPRFFALMAHFILLIALLWQRDNVSSCLPMEHSEEEYTRKENEITVGISVSIALLVIEIVGFVSAITHFFPMQCLFSLVTHTIGCATLLYFTTEVWDCTTFWYIFTFCSVFPALVESGIFFRVFICKVPL